MKIAWPRYMVRRSTKRGPAYYWNSRKADRNKGWGIRSVPLGGDLRAAAARAEELNAELEAWRKGLETATAPSRRPGTIDWMLHAYQQHRAFRKLSERSRNEYLRHMRIVGDLPTRNGRRFGEVEVRQVSARAVDRLYERLQTWSPKEGALPDGPRLRQANYEIDILKVAWRVAQRQYPDSFPEGNPFVGIVKEQPRKRQTKRPSTRSEAYELANALREMGHPGLGAAALICFEWLQRPENVLAGAIRWTDYVPGRSVRIEHWKTGVTFDLELSDEEGLLYPDIEAWLATMPRLGVPMVLWDGHGDKQGGKQEPVAKPYRRRHAHNVVARARKAAALPEHITLSACRHGGMTELGDAEPTEAQTMALSGHRQPDAARLYVKPTMRQRTAAARKRLENRAPKG